MKAIRTKIEGGNHVTARDADNNWVSVRVPMECSDPHRYAAERLIRKMGWEPVAVASGGWGNGEQVHVLMSPEHGDQRSRGQYWLASRSDAKEAFPGLPERPKPSADTEAEDVYGL